MCKGAYLLTADYDDHVYYGKGSKVKKFRDHEDYGYKKQGQKSKKFYKGKESRRQY